VTNPVYYILTKIKLVITNVSINYDSDLTGVQELVSVSESNLKDVGKILASDGLRKVAWYFLDYGAATSCILQFKLNIANGTVFRYIKILQKMGVIMPAMRSRHTIDAKGGPRPTIWMVPGTRLDDINDAHQLHIKLQSPKYVAGDRLGQLILEEYLEPRFVKEINGREILIEARKHKVGGDLSDIVTFATEYLNTHGIKVWK